MTRDEVQAWLDRYVAAWRSYDPIAIGDLFGTDAEYRYHPWDDDPVSGRDSIVADWLESPDATGSWEAHYEPSAVEGDRASAIGTTRYLNPDGSFSTLYHNHWTLRFDGDGRCTDFVEYCMELPERLRPDR